MVASRGRAAEDPEVLSVDVPDLDLVLPYNAAGMADPGRTVREWIRDGLAAGVQVELRRLSAAPETGRLVDDGV